MDFSFETLINTIFYVGAIQGFILTVVLFNIKSNKISSRLLGILTSLWAIILLLFAFQSYGLNYHYPHLLNTFSQLLFAWFPLLFLSVKYLITSHSKFEKIDLLHFIPMVLSILINFDFYLKSGAEKLEMVNNPEGYYYVANTINEEMLSIQGIVYSILTLIILKNYSDRVVDFQSNIDRSILKGLKIGVILSLIAWVIGIIGTIIERAHIAIGIDLFLFVYLFFVVIIYVISIIAIKSGEVFKLKEGLLTDLVKDRKKKISSDLTFQNVDAVIRKGSGNELGIQAEEFEVGLSNKLITHMDNAKPYLNPDFSLQALSEDLFVSRHQLSSTINTRQNMNFYEFVNLYRINEVKELMGNKANKNTKNYELAFDAGFNSKATFYRIFKKFTGQTPSDYRGQL